MTLAGVSQKGCYALTAFPSGTTQLICIIMFTPMNWLRGYLSAFSTAELTIFPFVSIL